jgi:hypothetical protein
MSGVFVEDPWSRIVDVHWKKKKPDPPDYAPPYCGYYGYGAIMESYGAGLVDSVPYGRNQFIPFVGTFSTEKIDPVYGGLRGDGTMQEPVETMTAHQLGQHASSILLQMNDLLFQDFQIFNIRNQAGEPGHFYWIVPMAGGQSPDGIPMVIKSYTINMSYHSVNFDPELLFGLGMSHPLPHGGEPIVPKVPFLVVGGSTDGAASYTYDFKVKETLSYQNIPNAGNVNDPNLGGPAFIWFMEKRANSDWSWSPDFMDLVLYDEGSWYAWEIIGSCQPMPNLFG